MEKPTPIEPNQTSDVSQPTSSTISSSSSKALVSVSQPLESDVSVHLDKVWQDPIYFLAFGFGTGLMKKAPGTWGTLAGVLMYLLVAKCSSAMYLLFTVIALIAGIFWCDKVSRDMQVHDYPGIVWDEVVGYLLTMYAVPFNIGWIVVGFILFRLFDIWKPEPIGWFDQRVKGGFGIMLDDVIAAIPAWFILHVLIWIFES